MIIKKKGIFRSAVALLLLMGLLLDASSQIIFSLTAVSTGTTAYTNGMPNNQIFYYCAGSLGQLRANPPSGVPGWNFQWQRFMPASNSWQAYSNQNNVATSTLSNLPPGGYRVTITDGTGAIVGQDIAWVSQILANPSVTVNPIPSGCQDVTLQGSITNGNVTPYYNPPGGNAAPAIFGPNTSVNITFNGTHTFVSDLAFVMYGPASCGSPLVYLMQSSEYSQATAVCNGGDNFTNLSFSSSSTNNLNVCNATTPLTGTYGRYGANAVPINWSLLNGCNLSDPGWSFQVWDCVAGDAGTLANVSATFGGTDASGNPVNVSFSSGALNQPISSAATTTSCPIENSGLPPATYSPSGTPATPIQCVNSGFIWTADPPFTIPNASSALSITLSPGPTVSTTFTLSILGSCSVGGCGTGTTTDSELYNYITPETAVITPVATMCTADAPVNMVSSISGGTWLGVGITDAALGTFDPAVAGPGVHTISFDPNGACQTGSSIDIEVLQTVDATITDPGILCETQAAFNLTAATTGGNWTGAGITDPTLGTFDPAVAGVGNATVFYEIPNTCNGTSSLTIQVDPFPMLVLSVPDPVCTGAAANLTTNFAGGEWSGTGVIDPVNGVFDPAVSGLGQFTLTYLVDNACGVSNTLVANVLQTVDPTITNPGLLCEADAAFVLTSATPGGTWSGNGVTQPVTGFFDPGIAGPGIHTIEYSVPNTCNSDATVEIEVAPFLVPTISGPATLCLGEAPQTLVTDIPGGIWNGDGITDAAAGTFTPATAGTGTANISYTYENGCTTTNFLSIEVINFINAAITDPGAQCVAGAPITLTAANPGGVWTGTGIVDETLGTFDPALAGVGTVSITYEIDGVCYGIDDETINVVAVPEPQINDPGIICANDNPLNLTANIPGGVWSGTGITATNAGTFSPGNTGAGTFIIGYAVTGVCSASTSRSIDVTAAPIVDAGANQQICEGETATLNAHPGGWDNVQWSGGNTGNPINVQTQGTYFVTVTQNGCSTTDQLTLTVVDLPVVNLGTDRELCEGNSATLDAGVSGLWSTGQTAASINVDETGEYWFRYTDQGCIVTDTVFVELFESPSFSLGADFSRCPNLPTVLAIPYQGLWNTGSFGSSISVTNTGNYSVTVTNGPCQVTDDVNVTILRAPLAILQPEYTICEGRFGIISGYNDVNDSYLWSDGSTSPTITINEPGTITLVTTNQCGQDSTSTSVLLEDCSFSIYIPNSFTPNNDGINDVWKPEVFNSRKYELNVFDKWGEVVFHTTDPEAVWTGSAKGSEYFAQDGIYFFQVKYETDLQEANEIRGHLFVLR